MNYVVLIKVMIKYHFYFFQRFLLSSEQSPNLLPPFREFFWLVPAYCSSLIFSIFFCELQCPAIPNSAQFSQFIFSCLYLQGQFFSLKCIPSLLLNSSSSNEVFSFDRSSLVFSGFVLLLFVTVVSLTVTVWHFTLYWNLLLLV